MKTGVFHVYRRIFQKAKGWHNARFYCGFGISGIYVKTGNFLLLNVNYRVFLRFRGLKCGVWVKGVSEKVRKNANFCEKVNGFCKKSRTFCDEMRNFANFIRKSFEFVVLSFEIFRPLISLIDTDF